MSTCRRPKMVLVASLCAALFAAGNVSAGCTDDADCEDGNPCTHNACSNRGRCKAPVKLDVPESSCTPGVPAPPCFTDVCTADAACSRIPKCSDGDPCTDDFCDASATCSHTPRPDGSACVADVCGSPGSCQAGTCHGATCDDHNVCTVDSCGTDGTCRHEEEPSGTSCAPDMDCRVFRCDGRGTCDAKVADENATCLVTSNVCSPWGLCKGDEQHRRCDLLRSGCTTGQPCATDGVDCSGTTPCGLVSTCASGTCVDQTCDVGRSFEPCGFHCGSQIVGGTCQATP